MYITYSLLNPAQKKLQKQNIPKQIKTLGNCFLKIGWQTNNQSVQQMQNKVNGIAHHVEDNAPGVVILTEHSMTHEKLKKPRIPWFVLKSDFSESLHRKGVVAGCTCDRRV